MSFRNQIPSIINRYEDSPLQKMEEASVVLFVYSDGAVEIRKNRHGIIGKLDNESGIETLINLLARAVFNDTCVIFQESLKKMIYKEIGRDKFLEGEENDKIRRTSVSDGAYMR